MSIYVQCHRPRDPVKFHPVSEEAALLSPDFKLCLWGFSCELLSLSEKGMGRAGGRVERTALQKFLSAEK